MAGNVEILEIMDGRFHLHALDLGATHAAAAVHQEQQLSGGVVQLRGFTQQVGTEVEHQDGAVENVLVVPLPHKLNLEECDSNRSADLSVASMRGSKQQMFEKATTFLSASESFLMQRIKSLREQMRSSYWLNESLPLSRMTSGL